MKIIVTKEFKGQPDNEPYPRKIAVGEILEGSLADVALAQKWGKKMAVAPQNKMAPEPENKSRGLRSSSKRAKPNKKTG